jgi:hypothetical protein
VKYRFMNEHRRDYSITLMCRVLRVARAGLRMGTVRKIRQSDRIKRLELLGRHVGVQAFKDAVDVSVTDGLADRVKRAKARGIEVAAAAAGKP